ncbi:hypothetical protein E4T47_08169 [Aureobasidium subglaciale]|nr:hypothetical protein E4T43_08573 [Aureobasidium subglaciale]KAI5266822.1 hypothetical protein E4T47_08169 [Aureobasidium subglaciale]
MVSQRALYKAGSTHKSARVTLTTRIQPGKTVLLLEGRVLDIILNWSRCVIQVPTATAATPCISELSQMDWIVEIRARSAMSLQNLSMTLMTSVKSQSLGQGRCFLAVTIAGPPHPEALT